MNLHSLLVSKALLFPTMVTHVCMFGFVWRGPSSMAAYQLPWLDRGLAGRDCPLIKPLYHKAHRVQGGLSKSTLMSLIRCLNTSTLLHHWCRVAKHSVSPSTQPLCEWRSRDSLTRV